MKVAIIHNKDMSGVINQLGMQNKETYSEKTVLRVAKCLENVGHNVAVLDGNKYIIERLEDFMPRVIEGEQMGMVFNMAYGIQGECRYTHIPSLLEMLGIPYVGSSPSGHALALDKVLTKVIWKNNGLPTPDYWVFSSTNDDMASVKYPVIVKPKMESVSFGLRVVYNEHDLKEAVHFIITEFQQQALVEQFIRGREFCVGILGNSPVETFPVLEIDLENDPDAIQTEGDKKQKPRNKVCPANISGEIVEKMSKFSRDAFKALDLRDFARVDIRMDEQDNIYLLEINSMASLGLTGSYFHAAQVAGYDYQALAAKMLDVASIRYFTDFPAEKSIPNTVRTPLHSRLRTFLRGRQPQSEKLLKKLVNINTHVRNTESVNKCSQIVQAELSQLGFTYQVYPQHEVGNPMYFTNSFDEDLDVLIMLSLDSKVSISDHQYYNESDRFLYGTGIWDNKGGIAVCVSALQALKYSRSLKKKKIGIILATDDTLNGKYSGQVIDTKSLRANYIIGMHGGTMDGGIVTSRSGSASYRYTIRLKDNTDPEKVVSVSALFNKTLMNICELSQKDDTVVISPYEISFKSNIFRTSAYGSAGLSVRFNCQDSFENIDKQVRKLASPSRLKKDIEVIFDGGIHRLPMPECDNNKALFEKARAVAQSIDIRVKPEHRWSSSELCNVEGDKPRIGGMGPLGEWNENSKEKIVRASLIDRSLLLAMLIRSL